MCVMDTDVACHCVIFLILIFLKSDMCVMVQKIIFKKIKKKSDN